MSDTVLYARRHRRHDALDNKSSDVHDKLLAAFSSSTLATFPHEILLMIIRTLDLNDLLLLEQTCRLFLGFSRSSLAVWRRHAAVQLDKCKPLPLNGFQQLKDLSARRLAHLVVQSAHLQHNWSTRCPQLSIPHKVISTQRDRDIIWISPITSAYILYCTKNGEVCCWNIARKKCVATWFTDEDWQIWKCRVEFDERIAYLAMARTNASTAETECQLLALHFPSDPNNSTPLSFVTLSRFVFPGHVFGVYLLDPTRRVLSAYVWRGDGQSLGLYVLMDWDVPLYTFIDTGITYVRTQDWSCIGYEQDHLVIHAEDKDSAHQYFYPMSLLQQLSSAIPPTRDNLKLVTPTRTISIPFMPDVTPYAQPDTEYHSHSTHFVRQWWPVLPDCSIRKCSSTIALLCYRDQATNNVLFTIAHHYFTVPLIAAPLRRWFVPEPFEIAFAPLHDDNREDEDDTWFGLGLEQGIDEPEPEPEHQERRDEQWVPLISVDFGHAVWVEFVAPGETQKRLRFVTFPAVDMDRNVSNFDALGSKSVVKTLEIPGDLDLDRVCHIGIDQAQGTIVLGLVDGTIFFVHYD